MEIKFTLLLIKYAEAINRLFNYEGNNKVNAYKYKAVNLRNKQQYNNVYAEYERITKRLQELGR